MKKLLFLVITALPLTACISVERQPTTTSTTYTTPAVQTTTYTAPSRYRTTYSEPVVSQTTVTKTTY